MLGMERIGKEFEEERAYVPNLLLAAEAMNAVMKHLKPYLESGEVKQKGTFVIGTVTGDLHDIGKNLVSMTIKGGGYKVIDLGVDVATEKFLDAIKEHPDCFIGLSALLTTTMENMGKSVKAIKETYPETKVLIGGAPVSESFRAEVGADFYSPNAQRAVNFLNENLP
jgi:methanogenic corrinoid protein MtbC1